MDRDLLELGGSLGFLDEMYDQFQQQPATVDASWHGVLNGEPTGNGQPAVEPGGNGNGRAASPRAIEARSTEARNKTGTTRAMPMFSRPGQVTMSPITAQAVPSIWPLVNAYRSRGHFAANLDPLGLLETARIVELDPATWGFTEADMQRVIEPTGVHGLTKATLAEVLRHLQTIYAGSAGLEFMHISSPAKRSWLAEPA
jgi:2-oxoglutarate dehydrogenase E1 component